jgi:IMP dehydrogenase
MKQINYAAPQITEALTYDDVLLTPQASNVSPAEVSTATHLSPRLRLDIPLLSSAMDTVTDIDMAHAMAKAGGLGVIHRNMSFEAQCAIIKSLSDANLQSAIAIGIGENQLERAKKFIELGVNLIVVDTAHGHSANVLKQVAAVRALSDDINLCGGNIVSGAAAQALINAGADTVKVGVGPGSICTTRIIAGVGVPQLTAILNVAAVTKKHGIGLIADGGLRHSGDIVKALAAGADAVMIGSLLAGTDEAPGDIVEYEDNIYKSYRGMGSIGAMSEGSADRYFQKNTGDNKKLVAEGVEGLVKAKGPVADILYQLIGGLKSGMGYIGAAEVAEMQSKAEFVRLTNAGLAESHVHDLASITKAPNYN